MIIVDISSICWTERKKYDHLKDITFCYSTVVKEINGIVPANHGIENEKR